MWLDLIKELGLEMDKALELDKGVGLGLDKGLESKCIKGLGLKLDMGWDRIGLKSGIRTG